jgi:hypothetical protein
MYSFWRRSTTLRQIGQRRRRRLHLAHARVTARHQHHLHGRRHAHGALHILWAQAVATYSRACSCASDATWARGGAIVHRLRAVHIKGGDILECIFSSARRPTSRSRRVNSRTLHLPLIPRFAAVPIAGHGACLPFVSSFTFTGGTFLPGLRPCPCRCPRPRRRLYPLLLPFRLLPVVVPVVTRIAVVGRGQIGGFKVPVVIAVSTLPVSPIPGKQRLLKLPCTPRAPSPKAETPHQGIPRATPQQNPSGDPCRVPHGLVHGVAVAVRAAAVRAHPPFNSGFRDDG